MKNVVFSLPGLRQTIVYLVSQSALPNNHLSYQVLLQLFWILVHQQPKNLCSAILYGVAKN